MKTVIILLFLFIFSIQISLAQETTPIKTNKASVNLGIGGGLTYGGLGARLVVNPTEAFNLFLALGYNLDGVGYNIGPMITVPSSTQVKFYLTAMYGYNAVILIEGLEEFNDTYYGVSAGAGIKLMSKRNPGSYWDFGLLVPFRSQDYKDDWDAIKNSPIIEVKSNPWPLNFCIGYNFKL